MLKNMVDIVPTKRKHNNTLLVNPRPPWGIPGPCPPIGGGGVSPPAICQTNEPIIDPKTTFNGSRLELSEYVAKNCLNVTDYVTDRIKV